ncbi:MAG TPA: 50S ribosomal protein L17 [Bacteroidia bacterium]|jgi:large subunit ribosomal protein L17|nr:50S ribosomal protein L17 [Bacteroidia bacterium]HRH09165.1 50S ribosomal protein L17 [Bacteroidia bacterium]HRH63167.1 50S ribosomal protein L17 [Bacteroidia bacterium]
MRHGKKNNHLGRTASHRKAMLANMACSLILHKKINTTVAKAKELRKYVEPLITKSKDDSTHSRRTVFAYLKQKEAVAMLFRDVATKVATRPGGYTRILKTGNRLGDNAEMCFIELVDYNEFLTGETKSTAAAKPKATRRSRGAKAGVKADADATIVEETTAEAAAEKKPKAKAAAKPKAEKTEKAPAKAKAKKKDDKE